MLTPRHHGFVGYNDRVNQHYDVTLPNLLAQGGYHTQCVGKATFCPPYFSINLINHQIQN